MQFNVKINKQINIKSNQNYTDSFHCFDFTWLDSTRLKGNNVLPWTKMIGICNSFAHFHIVKCNNKTATPAAPTMDHNSCMKCVVQQQSQLIAKNKNEKITMDTRRVQTSNLCDLLDERFSVVKLIEISLRSRSSLFILASRQWKNLFFYEFTMNWS